jgi:hypothetical protein
MFTRASGVLGKDGASAFLSTTNSCSHTDQNYQGVPSGTHCGVCFGCIVRRASFKASGLHDQTRYLSAESRYATYTASHSIVEAVRDFVTRGIDDATVLAMPLPPGLLAGGAKELCVRGLNEMESYLA